LFPFFISFLFNIFPFINIFIVLAKIIS
jgi:hypothetical protein